MYSYLEKYEFAVVVVVEILKLGGLVIYGDNAEEKRMRGLLLVFL